MSSPGGTADEIDRQLRLLINTVTDYAIFALDVDGNIISWNPGAERLKGWKAEEIIGRHFSVFYPEEDLRDGKPDMELAVAISEGRFEDEDWRLRKDGSRFWANVIITSLWEDDQLVGFGKVTRDLTERKRGEETVRDSEQRFRLLVESVNDYAIFMLDPEGNIESWNAGAQRLKGYSPDEIIGRHFSIFYSAEDVRAGKPERELRDALRAGRVEDEGWRIRKDGSRFWANVLITALHTDDGKLRGFAKVTRDLTDRKRSEDALRGVLERERATAERLRELDRLRQEFIAMVAHDLRSPMTVANGFAELIVDQWANITDEQKVEYLHRIQRTLKGLHTLVEDILEVSQIDAGQLDVRSAPFDLAAVLQRAAGEVSGNQDRVRITVHPGAETAIGDERRTWQVVSNLVSNALKFSPPDEPVEIEAAVAEGVVAVTVRDRGPGIPPEDQPRLFQRFSRLRPAPSGASGSGLGLYIAKSLVERQGGRIWVESEPDAGSTFGFSLRAEGPAAVKSPTAS